MNSCLSIPKNCAYTGQFRSEALTSGKPCTFRLGSFNGGVTIFHPHDIVDDAIQFLDHAPENSLHFADQSMFNELFKGTWIPLPYTYNAFKSVCLNHASIFQLDQVKLLHLEGKKPWEDKDDPDEPLHRIWWDLEEQRVSEEEKAERMGEEEVGSHPGSDLEEYQPLDEIQFVGWFMGV